MRVLARVGKAQWLVCLLAVLSVLLTLGYAWASAEGGQGAPATEPPIRLLYRVMNFIVLVGALFFLLRKPVAQGLASRRQGIKDQLEDLERQKQEAELQLTEYKKTFSRLDAEVQKIVSEYVQQGETAKAKIIEVAKISAEKLQEQAKKNIAYEFEKAKQQLKAEMAEQAVAMAEELIKENIKDDDHERMIDEYLAKVVVAQ